MQLVRVSVERVVLAASSSLSDSLESGPLSERGALESDSGLEQSGDELEPPALRRHHHHEEAEYDDDIDLDQEIPGLNSDEDDNEDDLENDDEDDDVDEGENKAESKDGKGQVDLQRQPRPSRIPGGVLLRRRDDDEADIARLEDEMSEPEDGLHEPADSDTEEPLGKEKASTTDAITQMLSRLAVEGGPDYQDRRDMTIR